jgi:hypothetical protein
MSTTHFAIAEDATGVIVSVGAVDGVPVDFLEDHWPIPDDHTLYTYDAPLPLPLPAPFDDYIVASGFVVAKATFGATAAVVGGGDWLADGVSTLRITVTGLDGGDTVLVAVAGPPAAGMAEETGDATMDFTTSEPGAYRFRVRVTNASGGKKPVSVTHDAV